MSGSERRTTGALRGRAALVTGGSRGIGAAVVRRLAADGAAVAVNYRIQAERLAAEIDTAGGHAITVQGDVAVAEEIHQVVETAAGDSAGSTSSSATPGSSTSAAWPS
ncbi:SDR family NAD(P)-dependent oxidoreductase [Amycolatopsis australiensis]|uniref:SDR family NAD(P)-dependent oxidoreductase n=1 Tax=Amycolatopsis australiensis TaxID=546364 RepID=UPI001C430A34|nr:SDR family NAD(P)-dependent oxidoreductase [Amycolatopsis australiensis]